MCTHKCAHTFGMWLWLLFLCIGSFWIDRRNPSKSSVLAMAPGTTNYCSIYIFFFDSQTKKKSLFFLPAFIVFFSRVGTPIYKCVYHLSIPGTVMTSIFEGQSPKTKPFPTKTKVVWVPGILYIIICFSSHGKSWDFRHIIRFLGVWTWNSSVVRGMWRPISQHWHMMLATLAETMRLGSPVQRPTRRFGHPLHGREK